MSGKEPIDKLIQLFNQLPDRSKYYVLAISEALLFAKNSLHKESVAEQSGTEYIET